MNIFIWCIEEIIFKFFEYVFWMMKIQRMECCVGQPWVDDILGNEGIGRHLTLSRLQDQSARVLFDVAIQPPMPQQFFRSNLWEEGFFFRQKRVVRMPWHYIFVGFLVLFLDAFWGGMEILMLNLFSPFVIKLHWFISEPIMGVLLDRGGILHIHIEIREKNLGHSICNALVHDAAVVRSLSIASELSEQEIR